MPRGPPSCLPDHSPTESTPPCPGRKAVLVSNNQFFRLNASLIPDRELDSVVGVFCEKCYKFNVGRYPALAINFRPYHSLNAPIPVKEIDIPSERLICEFWLPIIQAFYTQCVPQNNIQPLVTALQYILQLPACPGNAPRDKGDIWTSTDIPDCTICRHCWETYLRPSSFAHYFHHELCIEGQQWCCDIGKGPGYVHDVLIQSLQSSQPDFLEFSRAVNKRLLIAPCPGEGNSVPKSQDGLLHMYNLANASLGVCSECYHDQIALTSFSSLFALEKHHLSILTTTCSLAPNISKFLLRKAMQYNDPSIWYHGIEIFNSLPKCSDIGGTSEEQIQQSQHEDWATWYCVRSFPSIEACPSCYNCFIVPLRAGHLFTPITRKLKAGMVRVCNFSIGVGGIASFSPADFPTTLNWRGFILRIFLDRLSEAPVPNFNSFLSICLKFDEAGPPCGAYLTGFKKVNGRRWFGRLAQSMNDPDDCTVSMCQECYNDSVKDTSLEMWLSNDLTAVVYHDDADGTIEGFCGPWDKTSKAVLKLAAETHDFGKFARYWNQQLFVRSPIVPIIKLPRHQYETPNIINMSDFANASKLHSAPSMPSTAVQRCNSLIFPRFEQHHRDRHQFIEGNIKSRCYYCRYQAQEKKRKGEGAGAIKRTYEACNICELPLCANCWDPYHDLTKPSRSE